MEAEKSKKIWQGWLRIREGVCLLVVLILFAGAKISVLADGDIEISTPDGLLEMAADPAGSYILTDDIDMAGREWPPFSFHGSLDGDGHAILNLSVKDTGEAVRDTYDGNMKVYETSFAAMFDVLDGKVENLTLLNLQTDVETDRPCFAGSIAGYMENAVIADCQVEGTLTLRAHEKMFGVGGIAGYGYGQIDGCSADVTLVCIDTDSQTRDEQFMGGVCGAGYPDVTNCNIRIDGYASEHGYAHNGGLIGMYILYPRGTVYAGAVTGNQVDGKITFYEDNTNRRAYCAPYIGEIMNWTFAYAENKESFRRDEVYAYEVDLLPMRIRYPRADYPEQYICRHTSEKQDIMVPDCETFGYTLHTCGDCGYSWKDTYTLRQHEYEWKVEKEPHLGETGLRQGICTRCGARKAEEMDALQVEDIADQLEEFVRSTLDILLPQWSGSF